MTNQTSKEIHRSGNRKQKHANGIEKKKQKFAQQIRTLENRNCNVREVKRDLAKLNQLYDVWQSNWTNNYNTYISRLEETRNYACIDQPTEFDQSIKIAKAQHKILKAQVKSDRNTIDNFLKNTFQTHIRNITCS